MITAEVAGEALDLLEVDAGGLDRHDRTILETIAVKFSGGPVGLSTLAAAVDEEQETIEDVYEPYLLQQGLIKRTPRGRVITERGVRAPRAAGARKRRIALLSRSPARNPIARLPAVPFFICPNCGNRELSGERPGLAARARRRARKCGAPFLFELLDDYYPAPDAAFFICDQEARLLDVGRNGFELTGLKDEQVIGRPVREVLGLEWIDEGDGGETADTDGDGTTDPIETTLEWGVRSLGKRVAVNAEGDLPAEAVADLFPAYDDDGGLLLVLTPQ